MMHNTPFCFLILGFISVSKCDFSNLKLQMFTRIGDTENPVTTNDVELFAGTSLTLICELISTRNDSKLYDNRISWTQKPNRKLETTHEINKAELNFDALLSGDTWNYTCVSNKFKLSKMVELKVREYNHSWNEHRRTKTLYCGSNSFQCGQLCIRQHYVCDGRPDCNDGSDESLERCNGDACKDKIKCNDGRCIPTSWCCDRFNDANCTVTVRPPCCQLLSESYEELEQYTYNPTVYQVNHSGARYLFISVCVVSILFSIVLLLLIVSRVVIFAKKTALQQQRHNLCESIALRNQSNLGILPCDIYAYRNSRTPRQGITRHIIIDTSEVNEVNDPLLYNPTRFNVNNASLDQPPSYVDVLRNNRMISEPPPPYTSRERLNDENVERN